MIAYIKKGHIRVTILKNMGCGFFKCQKPGKRQKLDVHFTNLLDIRKNPVILKQLERVLGKGFTDE